MIPQNNRGQISLSISCSLVFVLHEDLQSALYYLCWSLVLESLPKWNEPVSKDSTDSLSWLLILPTNPAHCHFLTFQIFAQQCLNICMLPHKYVLGHYNYCYCHIITSLFNKMHTQTNNVRKNMYWTKQQQHLSVWLIHKFADILGGHLFSLT